MKKCNISRVEKRKQRHKRILTKLNNSSIKHRVLITKSNCHIYCHLIDNDTNNTIFSVSTFSLKLTNNNIENSKKVSLAFFAKLQELLITKVVFDRGGYKYHGKIAAIANVLRENGINL